MDLAKLVNCVTITPYFMISPHLVELKLVKEFGDLHRHYQPRVPGLVPFPNRYLNQTGRPLLWRRANTPTEMTDNPRRHSDLATRVCITA